MPAPNLCVVSGTVFDENGVPAVGVTLYLKRVLLNGVLIGTAPIGTANIPGPSGDHPVQYIEAITSIAGGVVSFTVPQLSTIYLEGNVSGYNNGEVALSIPATATSTLEALTPATFPIDVTTFTFPSLVDTPDTYVGQALKVARVNAAETAIEFATISVSVTAEEIQDALVSFFPDVAPFDWTYDDAGDRVTLAILDATSAARGLMSTAYAARLDQLEVGDSPTFTGLTLSGLTLGSIPFAGAGGVISQDNAALFWDAANDRLGIGTASPSSILHINSAASPAIKITDSDSGSGVGLTDGFDFQMAGLEAYLWNYENGGLHLAAGNGERLTILNTGLVGINKSSSIAAQLHTLSNAIGVIPFIAEGPAGQTANLFEARVNGAVKTYIDASGNIKFTTDNTVDIGASGANRPRNVYIAGLLTVSGNLDGGGSLVLRGSAGTNSRLQWNNLGQIRWASDGVMSLNNDGVTDFNRLQFGGTTSSFPSLKRSTTELQARLADDSGDATLKGRLKVHANAVAETPIATHTLRLFDAAGTEYKVLCVAA